MFRGLGVSDQVTQCLTYRDGTQKEKPLTEKALIVNECLRDIVQYHALLV